MMMKRMHNDDNRGAPAPLPIYLPDLISLRSVLPSVRVFPRSSNPVVRILSRSFVPSERMRPPGFTVFCSIEPVALILE